MLRDKLLYDSGFGAAWLALHSGGNVALLQSYRYFCCIPHVRDVFAAAWYCSFHVAQRFCNFLHT